MATKIWAARTSAGKAVDHLEGGAGIIDEHLLAGHMALTHGRGEPALPGTVEFAEPAVAVPMDRAVLFPQQGQGDAGPLQLAMQHRPVGKRPAIGRNRHRRREQQPFQILVRKILGQRPAQTRAARAVDVIADCRAADVQADGNPALRQSAGVQP